MLAYLILASHDDTPVEQELIHRFDQDDPAELPFHADERVIWQNHDRTIVFFGWQAFTEVAGIHSHWAIDDSGLTAFSGYCWPHDRGWVHGAGRSWAQQLASYLEEAPNPPSVRDALFGHFTIISLPESKTGWIMPDWTSVDQLFTAEHADWTAISNRSSLCARAVTPAGAIPERSVAAAGWLVGEGWVLDEESGYWDVERPRAGSLITIEPRSGARVIEPRWSPLYPPEPNESGIPYEELIDAVEQDLRQTIRAVANLPVEERVLSLSGGKDSRTLLALILSEDLKDRFRFTTNGSPERADPIVAKMLADRFDLDWSLMDPTGRPADTELRNVQRHSHTVEGMTSAWAATRSPVFTPGVDINGTLGEGLRWGFTSRSAVGAKTVDEVWKNYQQKRPFDALRALKPEARAYYESDIISRFRELADAGIPLISLSALIMHEPFMHARVGPDVAWNPHLRVDPYMTPVCIHANHRLAVDQRPDPRFHLELQRRCSVELSKMPFERSAWYDEKMYAHLPDADDYRSIETVKIQVAEGRSWRIKHYAAYRPFIEEIVLDRSNPLAELLDRDRVIERIATGDHNEGRVRLIWGLLSAAVWTGHHEQAIKLSRY